MFDRITSNSEILSGKPVIAGTRISVSLVKEWLASGATRDQILVKYKQLTAEDIEQAIAFADSESVELGSESTSLINEIDTLDDAAFLEELKRRSGDWEGAVSWDILKAEMLNELEPSKTRRVPGLGKGIITIIEDDDAHLEDFKDYMP